MKKEEWFYKHPIDNTLSIIKDLINKYGDTCTLKDVMYYHTKLKNPGYPCPKCNSRGYIIKKINTYPSGLPDSGWVEQLEDDYIECDLCKGKGYTDIKYKPKVETKVVGYEVDY